MFTTRRKSPAMPVLDYSQSCCVCVLLFMASQPTGIRLDPASFHNTTALLRVTSHSSASVVTTYLRVVVGSSWQGILALENPGDNGTLRYKVKRIVIVGQALRRHRSSGIIIFLWGAETRRARAAWIDERTSRSS